MTVNQFVSVAKRAVRDLPEQFHPYLKNVAVDVLDDPTVREFEQFGDEAAELLGLFEGVALLDQSAGFRHPNRIKLFRRNLEAASRNKEDLVCHIQETVVHEIAHHFGMSEEDLEPFEQAMEERRRKLFGDEG